MARLHKKPLTCARDGRNPRSRPRTRDRRSPGAASRRPLRGSGAVFTGENKPAESAARETGAQPGMSGTPGPTTVFTGENQPTSACALHAAESAARETGAQPGMSGTPGPTTVFTGENKPTRACA